jgi:hypothetical protein
MKNILLLTIAFGLLLISCKKESGDTATPVIKNITALTNRTDTLSSARYSQWILIKGAHLATTYKVDFNGTVAVDSLVFADDTSVAVKIPGPLTGATTNPVTVYTQYGQATYNFIILPPAPTITGFNPVSGGTGDTVTITGDWFSNLVSVKFDNTAATVISSTRTQIKVKVPAGISQAYIYVATSGGTTKSASAFGFKFIIYDEVANTSAFWVGGGWGGSTDYQNTAIVKRGIYSIKVNYSGGWGSPIQMGGGTLSLTGYTAVKISIYGGTGSNNNKIKLILNTSASNGVELVLSEGKWTDYTILLSDLGNPSSLTDIWLQEFSGVASEIIYVDDFGLI